jgi:hypothetical protein
VKLANQRSATRDTVTDLMLPVKRTDSRIRIQPMTGSFTRLPSTSTAFGCCLSVPLSARKLSLETPFFLKVGYLARPSKKFLKATPRFLIACCGAFFVTSPIHGKASPLMAFRSRRRDASEGFGADVMAASGACRSAAVPLLSAHPAAGAELERAVRPRPAALRR